MTACKGVAGRMRGWGEGPWSKEAKEINGSLTFSVDRHHQQHIFSLSLLSAVGTEKTISAL